METTLDTISTAFRTYWTETVEPVALKCAPWDIWGFAFKIEHKQLSHEEAEADPLMGRMNSFADFTSLWYVGHMINDVRIQLGRGEGIRLNMLNSLTSVANVLAPDSTYWQAVWQNDFTTEEARNLRELGALMKTLISKL